MKIWKILCIIYYNGGALMQLVAYGAQDIYLTGNPQITFFKVVYRRHTNFSIEAIEQTYTGVADFGQTVNVIIARNGDLVGPIILEPDLGINLTDVYNDSDAIGDYKYSTNTEDYHGWLLCDGRLLDKRQYKRLFQKIGTNFGYSSSDSNLFRLPDARSKVFGATGTSATLNLGGTVDVANNKFVLNTNSIYNIPTGTRVVLSSTLAPNPLTNGEFYYVIALSQAEFRVAISEENALSNTPIVLTTTGTNVVFTYNLTNRSIGQITGEEQHKLRIRELASHVHTGTTDVDGLHNHGGSTGTAGWAAASHDVAISLTTTPSADDSGNHSHSISSDGNHTHTFTTNSTGNDIPHSSVQPTIFAGRLFIYGGLSTDIAITDYRLKDYYIRWGYQLLDHVSVEIGGQQIDKHYGEWMDIWSQMTYTIEKYNELLSMINCSIIADTVQSEYDAIAKLYIPLQFWFCRNPGLYLPLIALQYHEVKLIIVFHSKSLVNTATPLTSNVVKVEGFNYTTGQYTLTNFIEKMVNFRVYCDYVFLDTDERRRFAQVSHEYLIEQVQTSGIYSSNNQSIDIPLYFNHPCKTLVWRGQRSNFTFSDDPASYTYDDQYLLGQLFDFGTIGGYSTIEGAEFRLNNDVVRTAKLQLNGQDRFKEREGNYFRIVQPFQWISPSVGALSTYQNGLKRYGGGFYMYNFSMRVDEHQPSGTCNFSRIDNSVLILKVNPYATLPDNDNPKCYNYNYRTYAVNYNVLRIMSGMGGLAYSN